MLRLPLAIVLVAGCAKHDAPGPAAGSAAPVSSAAAGATRGGGCDKVPVADFQALIMAPLTEVSGAPVGACNAYIAKGQAGFVLAALMYTDGAPHPFEPTAPHAHALPGIGDTAYWVPGQENGPRLEAMKGKYQCEVEPPDRDKSTIKSMSEADQTAYAQLQGKLCNDMFAAL